MRKTILISLGIITLILFSGCNVEDPCSELKGTCDYYSCRADESTGVSLDMMYTNRQIACLKTEELKLLKLRTLN